MSLSVRNSYFTVSDSPSIWSLGGSGAWLYWFLYMVQCFLCTWLSFTVLCGVLKRISYRNLNPRIKVISCIENVFISGKPWGYNLSGITLFQIEGLIFPGPFRQCKPRPVFEYWLTFHCLPPGDMSFWGSGLLGEEFSVRFLA